MENQTAFMEYQETVMNRKSSRAYKEATTQQHQEAVRGIPRSFNGYQEALTEYHEALTKTSCKFVSRFRPHEVRQIRLKEDAKPGQDKRKYHEMAPKREPTVSQSAPKGHQIDAKTCQDPQNDA